MTASERGEMAQAQGISYSRPARWPAVSVIMPARNSAERLRNAVDGLLAQNYEGEIEIVLACAPSKDRTEEIARQLEQDNPQVAVIRVPGGDPALGLTAAVYAATHSIIVRAGQRGVLPPDYIARAVAGLLATGAACVGGVQVPVGKGPFRQAVARAMTSKFGIGGARFHVGGQAGATRSVYLGAYQRSAIESIGGFDPRFGAAYDWELNYRIRRMGGLIWFDPSLQAPYVTNGRLRGLAATFFRAGWARRAVVRAYPETLSARYLAAPTALATIVAGLLVALALLVLGQASLSWLGLVPLAGYLATVLAGGIAIGRQLPVKARAWLPLVLACMHLSWGLGYLVNLRGPKSDRRP